MSEPMHPIQAMVNGMGAHMQTERAKAQMTLGKLIATLEALPSDAQVPELKDPHSYRGYYVDLAFEPGTEAVPAAKLLTECRACMGKVFQGYKGGDYMMGEATPVWVSEYGTNSGLKLMGIAPGELSVESDNQP